MDKGAWWAAVHGVVKSQTWLSDFTFTFHFHVLEKAMATHSSVLAWRIPGMAEPGGLPSMGSHRVRHSWSDLAAAAARSLQWAYAHTIKWKFTEQICSPDVSGNSTFLSSKVSWRIPEACVLKVTFESQCLPPLESYFHLYFGPTIGSFICSVPNQKLVQSLSCVRLFVTSWTAAGQASLSPSFTIKKGIFEYCKFH